MELIKFENYDFFSSDFYILKSSRGIIVIDAGFYSNKVKEYLMKLGNIDAILLTHGHFDHIQALDEIKNDFPEVKVYIHIKDYEFLKRPEYNLSLKHGFNLVVESEVEKLNDGEFKVGDYEIELIHTPGHTGGSCMYYFKKEKLLFTGDTIGPREIGNFCYPTSSKEDIINSINTFKNLNLPMDTNCVSSHWGNATYNEILINNPYLNM